MQFYKSRKHNSHDCIDLVCLLHFQMHMPLQYTPKMSVHSQIRHASFVFVVFAGALGLLYNTLYYKII